MIDFLNRKLPFIPPRNKGIGMDILIGGLCYFILVVFQPFEISRSKVLFLELKLLGFGFIAFLSSALFQRHIAVRLPKYFNEASWTVGRSLGVISTAFLFMSICNWIYFQIFFVGDPFYPNFFYCVLYTLAIGIIPVAFFVFHDYITILEGETGVRLLAADPEFEDKEPVIAIEGHLDGAPLLIPISKIILCSARGNYLSLYYYDGSDAIRITFRKTMSSLSQELQTDNFIRCHRSHLVNMNYVTKEEGNTRGMKLTLNHIKERIQVSRPYVQEVQAWLTKKHNFTN